jgi:hypothetical protein
MAVSPAISRSSAAVVLTSATLLSRKPQTRLAAMPATASHRQPRMRAMASTAAVTASVWKTTGNGFGSALATRSGAP